MKRTGALLVAAALSVGIAFGAAPSVGATAEPLRARLHGDLRRALGRLSEDLPGVAGFMIRDLASGEEFESEPDRIFPAASVIKVPIFLELLRQGEEGTIDLARRGELDPAARVAGGGVLETWSPPYPPLSAGELAVLMMDFSDNFAANLLIDRVGIDRVNRRLRVWGFRETRLQRKMMDIAAARAGRENLSTPRELASMFEKLLRVELLSPDTTRRAIAVMKANQSEPPRRTPIKEALPEGVEAADKEGELEGVRCAAGIVFVPARDAFRGLEIAGPTRPFVLAVMTTALRDDTAGGPFIGAVTRAAFDYFAGAALLSEHGRRLPP